CQLLLQLSGTEWATALLWNWLGLAGSVAIAFFSLLAESGFTSVAVPLANAATVHITGVYLHHQGISSTAAVHGKGILLNGRLTQPTIHPSITQNNDDNKNNGNLLLKMIFFFF
ncbi:unnamed protein product, partial [Discosporangium mesarthrocarpum]